MVTARDAKGIMTAWLNVCAENPVPGDAVTALPARGSAIAMPSKDWANMFKELETACRELGSNCPKTAKLAVKQMKRMTRYASRLRPKTESLP